MITLSPEERFLAAIAIAPYDPQAVFRALHRLADEKVGARLFTLMAFDARTRRASRLYTSDPAAYPVSGTKPLPDNRWTAQVIDRHDVFVANDIAAIADVFPDHELIDSLGCQAVINVPVVFGGEVLGTVNCLQEAGHYTGERIAAAATLILPGLLAFLSTRVNGLAAQ